MKLNSNFTKNIALLASGSILAQLIVVICSPLITRCYTVEDIGFYSLFISFMSIFTAILNCRYDMGIVSCDDDEVFPLVKAGIFIGLVMTVIATCLYSGYLLCFLGGGEARIWTIPLFAVLCLANAFNNVFTSYNNRMQEYKLISSVYVVRNAIQNVMPLALSIASSDAAWLIIFYVVGQLAGLGRQSASLKGHWREILSVRLPVLTKALRYYKSYPLYSTPAMLANSFSYSSISLALEKLFSETIVGYYSLSTRVLGLPITLIGGNISKVFFQEASEEYRLTGAYQHSFQSSIKLLIPISLLSFCLMFFLAKPACVWFFGSGWEKAGEYIQLLSPMFSFQLICTAISSGLLVRQMQNIELVFQIALALTTFIAAGIYLFLGGSEGVFLTAICILKSLVYIGMTLVVWGCSKNMLRRRKNG